MSRLNLSDLEHTDLHRLDVVARYSEFAPVYDESVKQWGYQCYRSAAQLLQPYVAPDQPILDAGCGTGLVGQALQGLGYRQIAGMDISPDMLRLAARAGCYRQLLEHNLSQAPYPFDAQAFAAVACIGVFSLIADPKPILQEFWRLIRAGGYLVFTQQAALFAKYGYEELLREFERQGRFRRVSISEPVVYLPQRAGYEDRTVIYCLYEINKDK